MATGERRPGSSARRGMTVLGKIPAVPKPINLPSQRLENRGLDPSVEIVPRGTFSWGTGRSPPASSSSWGNVGLSSSPPVNTGAWNTASINVQPVSSPDNVSGGMAQNPPRPLSAGSTRPLSAGTTRPSSASATSGRAWIGAPKLDEQLQPSRFNLLATGDFPTLGSEKNPNLRPQQNMAPSNRPTSADATKERNLAHTGTSLNRPTSADGSKERKPVYPGVAPADRPTSADGSLVDKGRHQSDVRLPTFPPFVDGNLSDQRHPVYTGVVGHGTAGPGPGTHGQLKDDHNLYPPLVQHGIALPGSHMLPVGDIMHPGASQHDRYFNGPRAHSSIERDVLVLPMDARPGVYNSYPLDLGSNHFDRSRVHHPQSSWGPNHLDRSGVYQSHRPPPRASEHLSHSSHGIMQIEPPPYSMETAMHHEQGNRRDGFNTTDKKFEEQRARWAGRNVVYIGSSIDSREPSVSTSGSGRELQKPDMFTTSWGDEPKHSDWGNIYSGDTSMGMRRAGASSAMYEQTTVLPGGPEDRHREESRSKGAGHPGEVFHSVSSRGSDLGKLGDTQFDNSVLPLGASVTGMASKIPSTGVTEISSSFRQNVQFYKQEETVKSLMGETMNAGPELLKKGNDTWVNVSPLPGSGANAGMQPLKIKQEDERNRVKQSREPQRVGFVSNMANQRQEDNFHGNLESKNRVHIVDTDSPNGPADAVKNTNAKKQIPISQRLTKGNKKDDLCSSPSHQSEDSHCASKTSLSKVSEVNGSTSSSAVFSTSSGKECNSDVSSGVQVSSEAAKEASADAGSNGAVQAKSSTHTVSQDASAGDHKAMATANSTFPVAPVVETVAIPSSEEEGQALNDDTNTKARRNAHSSRRPHHSRSMHESHSVDKQHVNHGMVWAPVKTPTTVGATKEENPPNTEKAGKSRESIQHTSTEINHDKPMQPLQKHQPSESRSQRQAQQVQQMQSAASSQQAQGQQMQEHLVVSNKKQPQQMHHQKVEISSKQQGQRMQQQSNTSAHKESEQWMQQEQSTASSFKNQNLETKQSVASSYPEQFAASSHREVNVKEILPAKEQQEKAGESRQGPVVDKLDGKRNKSESTIYVPRPARNQQRQGREQEHDQRYAASSQRFLNKGERSVVEDQENQPSEISTLPVAQLSKNNDEVKSHHSRFSKQQKRHQHELSASLNTGERHAPTWKRPSLEEKGEQSVKTCVPSLVAEPEDKEESKTYTPKLVRHQEMQNKVPTWKRPSLEENGEQSVKTCVPSLVAEREDKEESKTYTRKLVRHQEMQNKQSAAGSHREQSHTAEEHKKPFVQTPDSTSCESSTNKSEMKLYIPKHRKQNTHQQACATTGYEGQKTQEQTTEEAHLSNEKDQHYAQGSQLSGVESNVKKDGIELYTPKPARQLHMQGHQSTSRGHRRQRNVDLAEGPAVGSSSGQATVESPLKDKEITSHDGVSDSMESKDVRQSCVTGNRDESKLYAPYESSQGKKEVKLYVAKPGRQQQLQHQQSVVNVDQGHVEVPMREGERSHQIPGTEPSKRKEEIKRYTPKPARQQKLTETSVVLEGKAVKETGELSLAEQQEQQRSENDGRANEFEHGYRSRNHLTKPRKPVPSFSRPQMKTEPPLEDGTVDDHTSRVDETNGAVIFKEHVKDRESGFFQKRGSRQRNHDVAERPTLEEAEVVRPKQYQKQHYQYQPVTQQLHTFKPREEDSNVDYEHKFNTRQQDHGHIRFERREGPPRRGRHHGYGYRAADHTG